MSRRRRQQRHSNHERWLVSYADFITLLFAFFVVLYSSSQVDRRKVGQLAMAIQVAFQELGVFQASTSRVPVDTSEPMPFDTVQAIHNVKRNTSLAQVSATPEDELGVDGEAAQLRAELERELQFQIADQKIALRREPDSLVISLREIGFFDPGSAVIRPDAQQTFDRIASILRDRNYCLRVEGHTDNVPIHNGRYSSNWELSTARATELVRLLIVRDGFAADRLSAAGFAEYHPVAPNQSAKGRSQNRRVDIVILSKVVKPLGTHAATR